MKKLMLFALLATGGFVIGCDKKDEAAGGAASKTGSSSGGADSIGVQECDDYLKKMSDCMGKMPKEAQAAQESAMKASKDAWKTAAGSAAGKDALKMTCKAALDAMAQNPMCK